MNPAEIAALCVSLTAGRTQAEILAAAIWTALAAYKNNRGGATR